jgi:hypothetical protein
VSCTEVTWRETRDDSGYRRRTGWEVGGRDLLLGL